MTPGARIAQIALAHVGSSSTVHPDVYQDVVRRPADAASTFDGFYLTNREMSDCALFAIGCWRLAGCVEPEAVASYFPKGGKERDAVADVQSMARRFSAWQSASPPVPPFKCGDVWVICNLSGNDAHVGVCVEDAVEASSPDVNAPGATRTVKTVEGGQFSGKDSSAIETFTRTFMHSAGKWWLGDRYLLGFVRADSLPIPDDGDPLPANPVSADPHT